MYRRARRDFVGREAGGRGAVDAEEADARPRAVDEVALPRANEPARAGRRVVERARDRRGRSGR